MLLTRQEDWVIERFGNLDHTAEEDPDNDGLTNLEEYYNNANPHNPDTDGDGTDDGTEADQGSWPDDPSDNGQPPAEDEVAELTINCSGDGSKDLALFSIDGKKWHAPNYTQSSGSRKFKLKQGEKYTLTLKGQRAIDPFDGTVSIWGNLQPGGAMVIKDKGEYKHENVSFGGGDVHFESWEVVVFKVELGFQRPEMSSTKVIDPLDPPKDVRIGVIKGDEVTFKAVLTPEDVTLDDAEYSWTGEKTGTGPEISVTFNNTGNKSETLTVLGIARSATTTVIYVSPPNKNLWGLLNLFTGKAAKAKSLGIEALQWSPGHNGAGDAKRHAYWNVLMTVESGMGARTAEGAATAYERSNLEKGGAHNEIVMDMENNLDGRIIGKGLPSNPDRAACQNAVINALNAGSLTILDNLYNGNEVGLLQPSDE